MGPRGVGVRLGLISPAPQYTYVLEQSTHNARASSLDSPLHVLSETHTHTHSTDTDTADTVEITFPQHDDKEGGRGRGRGRVNRMGDERGTVVEGNERNNHRDQSQHQHQHQHQQHLHYHQSDHDPHSLLHTNPMHAMTAWSSSSSSSSTAAAAVPPEIAVQGSLRKVNIQDTTMEGDHV